MNPSLPAGEGRQKGDITGHRVEQTRQKKETKGGSIECGEKKPRSGDPLKPGDDHFLITRLGLRTSVAGRVESVTLHWSSLY